MGWNKSLPDKYIIIEYVNNNRTTQMIAQELCVSPSTILRHLKANGIKIKISHVLSEDAKLKISKRNHGRKRSIEFCEKITGNGNHQFGRKNEHSPAWRNLPDAEIVTKYKNGMTIDKLSIEYKCSFETISRHLKANGVKIRTQSESISGNKNGRWNDGASFKPYCYKFNGALKEKIRSQYSRICQKCYEPENGQKLDVHHINFDKKSGCFGKPWNLIPLHHNCHTWTTNHRFEAFHLFANHWAMNADISIGDFLWHM